MMDRICSLDNLRTAFRRVAENKGSPGSDGVTIYEYGFNLEDNLSCLAGELISGQYRPQPVRRVMIPKPGSQEKRPLEIPSVEDRVVQADMITAT
jgi:RNA-directed DNA polymerase